MFYNPTLILDKSLLRGLGKEKIKILQRHYTFIVPTILMYEIIGEIQAGGKNIDELKSVVAMIASRLDDNSSIAYPNFREFIILEITGQKLSFTGQPMNFNARRVISKNGTLRAIIEEAPESQLFRNWGNNIFSDVDIKIAKKFRKNMRDIDLNKMRENLTKYTESAAIKSNIKTLFDLVGNVSQPNMIVEKNSLVNFVCGLDFDKEEIVEITEAIQQNTFNLAKDATYTCYVYSAFSAFYQGLKHGLVSASNKQKNHLDFEYFLYLPFANVICSDDKIFPEFFKVFSRKDQICFNKVDILREIELILEDEKFIKTLDFESDICADAFKSKTYMQWFNIYRPRENLVNRRSPEDNKNLAQSILTDINETIDFETGKATSDEYQNRYASLNSDEKFKFLSEEAEQIFEIKKGWRHVKQNINSEQIRNFYTLHADVWLPNQNISSLLKKDPNIFRGIYVGIIDLLDINEILYISLFFDELVIIDPFINSWYMQEKYNPISNPKLFKQDTLRNLWVYGAFAPFVKLGKIKIIPMPFPIFSKAHRISEEYARSRIATQERDIYGTSQTEFDLRKRHMNFEQLLSLPISFHKHRLTKNNQNISEEDINACIESIMYFKTMHPTALEQDNEHEHFEQMLSISSTNLEALFFIASELNCIPVTNSQMRAREVSLIYGKDLGAIGNVNQSLKNLDFRLIDNIELPGVYAMHISSLVYEKSMFIRDVCRCIRNHDYKKLALIANSKKLLRDFEDLVYIFDMFGSSIPEKMSKTPIYSSYNLDIISSISGPKIPGTQQLKRQLGMKGTIKYPPMALSFTKKLV